MSHKAGLSSPESLTQKKCRAIQLRGMINSTANMDYWHACSALITEETDMAFIGTKRSVFQRFEGSLLLSRVKTGKFRN